MVELRAFLAYLWSPYSIKALPLPNRTLHLVNYPYGSKNDLRDASSVSKLRPVTNNSSLPVCSSLTSSSLSFSSSDESFLVTFAGAAVFLATGFSLESSESDPESEFSESDESFLTGAFFAGTAAFFGFSLSEDESSLDESFLAAAFLVGADLLATRATEDFEESSESLSDED